MLDDETRKLTSQRLTKSSSHESIDDARFVAGTILADRYRIIGLLGKGGMGEVYRADDLKLSQPVALKFLPDRFLSDSAALARFYREVRVSRQVSHRNVCRVYDIGEIEGRHFLSMEFIKGEELSSLLRRIGRLPADKALQIARQVCAGLAAAHDNGILHRDLKPANVMIDAEGNARITDFGLGGLVEEFRDDELSAGTPAYMAPEQLDGQTPTVRTDIYSLGLLLYELFTGKRAYDAPTLGELIKLRRSDATPTTPTSLVKDLDPVIESVIDRCLQKDPTQRPASALQVAAALPGGDPIAAALAAGETPSPEMVAAAPKAGALRPTIAVASLAGVIACLLWIVFSSSTTRGERNMPFDKPPEVLRERAREIITSLGYSDAPVAQVSGFDWDGSFQNYVREQGYTNWHLVRSGQPAVFYFWHRQAPRYLVPETSALVFPDDPPLTVAGMTNVALDPRGRLIKFERVPPQLDEPNTSAAATNWNSLFVAAGVDPAKLTRTESRWVPAMYADERMAWEGPHVDHPDIPVRIEAASFKSHPVYFAVIFPWDRPLRQEEATSTGGQRLATIVIYIAFIGVMIGAVLLGRHNLKLERCDKRGAFKLAIFVFGVAAMGGVIGAHHVPSLSEEFDMVVLIIAYSLVPAALIWLMYIALEPYVRRRWPRLVISWTRLMAGNFQDPMVGRDLLIGGLLGLLHGSWVLFGMRLPAWFGFPSPPAFFTNVLMFNGIRTTLSVFLNSHLVASVFVGFAFLFVVLLFFILLRKQWLATGAFFVTMLVVELAAFASSGPRFYWLTSILISLTVTIAVTRFGLLATMAAQLFFFLMLEYPMTTDLSVWYIPATLFSLALIIGIAVYGFYTSLGGQRVFNGTGTILGD